MKNNKLIFRRLKKFLIYYKRSIGYLVNRMYNIYHYICNENFCNVNYDLFNSTMQCCCFSLTTDKNGYN